MKRKMEMRKKEEREALYSEKGKREKKNELNYKEQRIEKKNIAKEWRRERKMERRKKIGKEGRKMASFLESNSSVVRRKEGRRVASVSVIPGFYS